ncbi:sensor histidine kinase [Paenibacillus sp. HJL G12]|uniref:histidine kinase n=1 Tax=Paenibacillus dendrobii TaxID=2691084 RepID=A0A7X3IIK6_9BACL|nr:sensor histidine kinase [Paenibacillus dendrobii]MWV44188.1 sensor histidine kinase [Paenibacillus dendrobii]
MNDGHDKKHIIRSASRVRNLLLSLLLGYSIIQSLIHAPLHATLPGALLIIVCMCLQWWPRAVQGIGISLTAALVVGIGALSVLLAFGLNGMIYTVIIFLTGWATYRLPSAYSAIYTAAIAVIAAAILYYAEGLNPESVLAHCIGLAAIYLMFWGGKSRKETRLMKERHLEELTLAHRQLENAYAQLHQAHQELEEASERSLRYAVLEERSRIAADIHDSIGHGLTSVIVQLQALPYMIQTSPEETMSTLRNVTDIARRCLQDVRSVVHEMGLAHQGIGLHELRKLTESFSEQNRLPVSFTAEGYQAIPPEHVHVLYRVLQEALTNILRHAKATDASVHLTGQKDNVIMTIRDDGLAGADMKPGFGLTAMKGRCETAGGSLSVLPAHPHGLELTVRLPRKAVTVKGDD